MVKKSKLPVSEFLKYLRIRIGLSSSLIALLGYTINYGTSSHMWAILVAALFMTIGVYSFNLRTDIKEDMANKKKVNKYSRNKTGLFISLGFALLSLAVAMTFSLSSKMALIGSGLIGF